MIDDTVSLPLISVGGPLVLVIGLIVLLAIFFVAFVVTSVKNFKLCVAMIVGMIVCVVAAFSVIFVGGHNVYSARQQAFEDHLGARVISGTFSGDGVILLEKDGIIQRMSFNIYKDEFMLLTPIGGF